jgi:2-furoyl-CoA dehydrogenase large subunit
MDDIRLPNMKHAAILRSPYPHAWIRGIDVSNALKSPGVVGILTGAEVAKMSQPFPVGVTVPPVDHG